jgi:NAD+ kinase
MRCVLALKRTAVTAGGETLARRVTRRMQSAHDEHQRSLADVRAALQAAGVRVVEVHPYRLGDAGRRAIARADLVVSLGGDGTLLATSHHVGRGLMLGVNSAPRDSVGHFCGTDRRGFPEVLASILRGKARPTLLARLEVVVDGRVWQSRILNDVLVCHESPAATTRYEIATSARREVQRSSGIWIATPSGSTAAIRSAGGRVLPASSRRLQYRVRELYREPGRSYRLTGAVLAEGQAIAVVSRMPEGRLYADGARLQQRFTFGSRAVFRLGDEPLRLVRAARGA